MMDYRAGYYKLFGEITGGRCALLSAAAPRRRKNCWSRLKAARSLNIFPHWCCAGGQGLLRGGNGPLFVRIRKNNPAVRHRRVTALGARGTPG